MFFDEPPMEDEQVNQEEIWSAIRYLILTNGTRLLDCGWCASMSRSSSAALTLAMSVRQAAEGEEAVTLVGSVK
jgi:hypothetical protein